MAGTYDQVSGKILKFTSYLYPLGLILPFREKLLPETENNVIRKNGSDILLLLPAGKTESNGERKPFSSQNWSCAWINTLEQETGYFAVSDDAKDIKSRRLVIAAGGFPFSESMAEHVNNGGILVVERPTEEIFGIKITGRGIRPKSITKPKAQEMKMPLNTKIDRIEWNGSKTLMEMDSIPVILAKKIGKGHVILLAFDYGMQLVSMQQGLPCEDYSVRHRHGLFGIIEPIDMAPDRNVLDNETPYADILEKYLFDIIDRIAIIPRWWHFPYEHDSAMIMSHDEDYHGEKSVQMLDEEINNGVPSTFFVNSPNTIPKEKMAFIGQNNIDVGIHWDRFPNELFYRMSEQKDIETQIGKLGRKIISSRIHFLKWSGHYTNTFRILSNAGIKIDSTYGMNFGKGYSFCTSKPFHPIDTNGILMPILEIPFQVMEKRGKADAGYAERLMAENNRRFHGILCFNFHPSKHKSSKIARKRIAEIAASGNILMTNFRDYLHFYNLRANSGIRYIGRTIIIDAKQDMALVLPDHAGIKPSKGAMTRKLGSRILIKVKKGKHTLKLR